ncbi:MAG: NTP transferase domain-containing protein [Coriobacteriia bacterium]|nr:NTP transferase domain-containing protein [Coriobacteriia bacterium]MBS5478017.1 NTP transferase domain-containing protein [Coriobacteriia bacterium]
MKALIPAAGLGTRFLPTTKSVPKEMLPVLDKPVIQYVVEEALAAPQCDGCVIVTSRSKPLIEQYFSADPAYVDMLRGRGKDAYADACEHAGALPVSYVYQEKPAGLGDAVLTAAPETGSEPFYVLLGDVVVPERAILPKMAEVSQAHGGASVIAVIPVPDDEVSRFGIIGGTCISGEGNEPGAVWNVTEMVEKPALEDAPSHLAIFGRYLLSPRIMELLATQEPGKGNEVQLTDALVRVLAEEEMYAVVIDPSEGHDTGTIPNLVAAGVRMGLADERYASSLREALADVLRPEA